MSDRVVKLHPAAEELRRRFQSSFYPESDWDLSSAAFAKLAMDFKEGFRIKILAHYEGSPIINVDLTVLHGAKRVDLKFMTGVAKIAIEQMKAVLAIYPDAMMEFVCLGGQKVTTESDPKTMAKEAVRRFREYYVI